MSNHDGSYMLNEVIKLMEANNVFLRLGKKRSQSLLLSMIKLAVREHDCNVGEILEGLGKRLGICAYCCKPATEFRSGEDICRDCWRSFEQ
jgi:hypothetical protein